MLPDRSDAQPRCTLTETLRPVLREVAAQEGRPPADYAASGWVGASAGPSHQLRDIRISRNDTHLPQSLRTVTSATRVASAAAAAWARRLLADMDADNFDVCVAGIGAEHPGPERRAAVLPQIRPLVEAICWTDPALDWRLLRGVDAMVTVVPGAPEDFEPPNENGYHVDLVRHPVAGAITGDFTASEDRLKDMLSPAMADLRAALLPVLAEVGRNLSFTWLVAPPSAHQRMAAVQRLAETRDHVGSSS